MEPFLVPNDFDCDALPRFVIAALEHLTEGTFSEKAHDLVSIGQMIALDVNVVAPFVVVAVIVGCRFGCGLIFLAFLSRIPDRLVVQNFPTFEKGQGLEVRLDESYIPNHTL